MASALVFLVDKPLTAKGPQTYFDATHITAKKKHFKTLQKGEAPDIKGDIIIEVTIKDKIDWTLFLNALGSRWKTQIVPLIGKGSKLLDTIQTIEGYPVHPISIDGFDTLKVWYAEYVASLLKVRLK